MEKQTLPNATAVLVLGICSLVFGCFFVGLILGIIGIALSGKGRKLYRQDPNVYEGYGSLNAGFIMSIIGTVLGGLYTIYFIIVGGTILSMWANTPH
jgi:M penetrans paralogue family 26